MPSSSRRWNGWTGSTIGGSWSRSATSRRPKPRNATTPCWNNLPWRRDSNQMASDQPGAVHNLSRLGQRLYFDRGYCNRRERGFNFGAVLGDELSNGSGVVSMQMQYQQCPKVVIVQTTQLFSTSEVACYIVRFK